MVNKVQEIKAEIERHMKEYNPVQSSEGKYRTETYKELLGFIEDMQQKPVSEDLEETTNNYCVNIKECNEVKTLDTKLKSQINKTLSLRISQMEHDEFLEEACQWLSKNTFMTQEEIHSFRKAMKE